MRLIGNSAWQIEWIYTLEFPNRPVPLIILQDGKPGYIINKWIYWLLEEGTSPSTLEQHIRSVMQLYEFCVRTYGCSYITPEQSSSLISDFINAKRNGSVLMGWAPNKRSSTLKKYLHSINAFDKWSILCNNTLPLNPVEKKFILAYQENLRYRQSKKYDLLYHLCPSRTPTETSFKYNVKIEHQRFKVDKNNIPKAFPVELFVDLIESTRNPRDQMLWLLMGGGSLRQSETLHLFYEDVLGINEHGASRIRLADPETGIITWYKDGIPVTGTRSEYMQNCFCNEQFKKTYPALYQLVPRTMGIRGRDHAGFKGMTFSDCGETAIVDGRLTTWNELFWIEPALGHRFQRAYEEYVTEYFYNKPKGWPWHPWLFITTQKKATGSPLTLGAIRSAWKTALQRIGLGNSHLSPHSLRHMYGAYCASVLRLPIELTRTLMHHASATSTQTYYHIRSADVRNAITEAILNRSGTEEFRYLVMPDTPRLNIPPDWFHP
ncbi:tyrosine-type recombinase/integrase [Klebsiella aerogenes]|uniref:tyrosine-type recombinase/integrase n=1 Tax=Klebsiella aerogenes TaxID=548 RepID=UPI0037B2C628